MRIAIFGDVGGHYVPFLEGLKSLGMDDKGILPDDLVVIQLGDLIHKGPDSDVIVYVVDKIMKNQPDQWVQLFGNHEGQYVGGPQFWQQVVAEHVEEVLKTWWVEGKAKIAVAFKDENDEKYLVTHAGLSYIFWREFAFSTQSAGKVADIINTKWDLDHQFSPGYMLSGCPLYAGGPAWAHASLEVYQPWLAAVNSKADTVPFHQVHGHTTAYYWSNSRFSQGMEALQKDTEVDKIKRHSVVTIGGKKFICTDPGWGRYAGNMQHPYVIEGTII